MPIVLFFAGFSLAAWQIAEGVVNTFPIDSGVVDNLLSDLNVAALISYPACSPTDSEYANAMTNLQKCMNLNIELLRTCSTFNLFTANQCSRYM